MSSASFASCSVRNSPSRAPSSSTRLLPSASQCPPPAFGIRPSISAIRSSDSTSLINHVPSNSVSPDVGTASTAGRRGFPETSAGAPNGTLAWVSWGRLREIVFVAEFLCLQLILLNQIRELVPSPLAGVADRHRHGHARRREPVVIEDAGQLHESELRARFVK